MEQSGNNLNLKSRYFSEPDTPVSARFLSRGAGDRKVVHIAGLGDVGRTMAIGLTLEGGDVVERLGLFDLSENQAKRMAIELEQIAYPCLRRRTPAVQPITESEIFDCDIFLFCATKSIPEVGSGVQDVRMAQYEANRGIVALYAKKAAEASFDGLFGVVSDPVELLCRAALTASQEASGACRALAPGQIRGFGLGVMYARAGYYAKRIARGDIPLPANNKDDKMTAENTDLSADAAARFPTEGRAFGPHGADLVIANSLTSYDDELSRELTRLTVQANLEVRALGFKPFIAPALSSAALTVLGLIRGEWTDCSSYIGGIYFGARCRTIIKTADDIPAVTAAGGSAGQALCDTSDSAAQAVIEYETTPLPPTLAARVEAAYRKLDDIAGSR